MEVCITSASGSMPAILLGVQHVLGGEEASGPGYSLCINTHYAWVQRLFRIIPGARGYLGKEKLREADILIRRYVAENLDKAVGDIEAARSLASTRASQSFFSSIPMASAPPIPGAGGVFDASLIEALRSLSIELQNLSSDILYADSGWAPIGAVQAMREDEIRRLCEYDDSMIGLAEAAASLAWSIREAVEAGNSSSAMKTIEELRAVITSLRGVYSERKRYLTFVTHQGLSAREALSRLSSGAGSMLSRARSLLQRLGSRLHLSA